jgi:hypothetical protein
MASISPHAFVETKFAVSRGLALNETVRDAGITIMLGDEGAGKSRFLDWWWQVGASHQRVPDLLRVPPTDIVLINLAPSPGSSVSVSCVALSMIWSELRLLERAAGGGDAVRPVGRVRSLHTDAQFLSLFSDHVVPLMKELQPRAVVIGNAHYLDDRALHWLLLLRRYSEQGHALLPRHALILSARTVTGGEESGKFAHLMNGHDETKIAWSQKILLSPMPLAEFVMIIATLLRVNLNAVFGKDVDSNETTKSLFFEWTQANWWYIAELVRVLDQELGPGNKSGEPRVITSAVIDRLREGWVKRLGAR